MKKMNQIRQMVGIFTAFALILTPSIQAYTEEYAAKVANTHLQTFPVIEKPTHKEESLTPKTFKDILRMISKPLQLGLRELNERDKREIAFKQMPQEPNSQENVVDAVLVDKLNIIRGDARPNDHLMGRLTTGTDGEELLQTSVGVKRFVEMVSQPMTDIAELRKRQTILRELVKNDALRTQCNKLLAKIRSTEPLVFDIYSRNPESEEEKMGLVDSKIGLKERNILSLTTRGQELLVTIPPIIGAYGARKGIKFLQGMLSEGETLGALFKQLPTETKVALGLYGVGMTAYLILLQIITLFPLKVGGDIRLNMQERLIGLAIYLASFTQLASVLKQDIVIGPLMPELKKISQQLEYDETASKEFNSLNALLRKRAFKEGPPSRLSSPGNIVNAYRYAVREDVRKEYAAAMNMLGELDVYVALANKIKAHEGLSAQFCFAEFIEESDKPVVKATNFWNPFVDHTMVVGNDVALNTGQERDIILTGPNTGGKSTIMKGLMFSVLMAQTFGIAPAQSLTITPFTKLTTYLNIADDTGAGISLFKAEVLRAKEVMETVRTLKPNEFAFLIIDEMFTGTSPDKGEELSFNFAKQLAEFANVIFIQATHFRKLTELPALTNGVCRNYYTGVIIEAGKVIKYTYKLVPGISPISTAEQIAKEEEVFDF